jgi:NTE family protein
VEPAAVTADAPAATPPPKLGLALSGGGFRAAFFHVGLLARMAELGVLRRVEVLSCVSGGSIVGALYYLHVRDLLQTKPEREVTDADYVRIVDHVERSLVAGVQTNVRARAFGSLRHNFRMAKRSYSRSERMGELYDETFYRPAWNRPIFGPPPTPPLKGMVEMRNLRIEPPDAPPDFNPMRTRRPHAPVPVLVVNATTLNTGHNWRFEVSGMGEPDRAEVGIPEQIAEIDPREDARREIDRNNRLRWTRYELLPRNKRNIELGIAVAASSCVPSLFHPLPIVDLFRRGNGNPINVELVDGGVHDNQGIEGLIEFKCDMMIVSDASGYMPDQEGPRTRIPAVLGRTISIYGDRVREEQLMTARLDDDERPFALAHLRKGITGVALAPLDANGEPLEPERGEPPDDFMGERFNVHRDVQDALSRVRTDLDAFSEIEAYSLMLDGYRMAEPNLTTLPLDKLGRPGPTHDWRFLAVGEAAATAQPDGYMNHLNRARSLFLKPFHLSRRAMILTVALAASVLILLAGVLLIDAVRDWFAGPVPRWALALELVVLGALLFLYVNDRFARRFSDFVYTQVLVFLLAIPVWLISFLVIALSRMFVRAGRVESVLGTRPPD